MIVSAAVWPFDPALLALNNAAVPHVNALGAAEFDAIARAGRVWVATTEQGAVPIGFVVTLARGVDYDSLNYAWFSTRFDAFTYVDRVVVSPAARGRGVGRALYDVVAREATLAGHGRVCAEVNVDPPNPGSMAFHTGLGFHVLAERHNESAGKTVAMLEWLPERAGHSAAAA